MSDREKIVEALEETISFLNSRGYGGVAHTVYDAIAMLKDQEAVKPEVYFVGPDKWKFYRCPVCKIAWYYKGNYCLGCGREVDWDENH